MTGKDCTTKHSLAFPRAQSYDYLYCFQQLCICVLEVIFIASVSFIHCNVLFVLRTTCPRHCYVFMLSICKLTFHYLFDLDSTCAHVTPVYQRVFYHHFCLPFVASICLWSDPEIALGFCLSLFAAPFNKYSCNSTHFMSLFLTYPPLCKYNGLILSLWTFIESLLYVIIH